MFKLPINVIEVAAAKKYTDEEQYDILEAALSVRNHDPGPNAHSGLRRQMAQICLKLNKQLKAAFNLAEALGVEFRTKATLRFARAKNVTKDCSCDFADLIDGMDLSENELTSEVSKFAYSEILKDQKQMPQVTRQVETLSEDEVPLHNDHLTHRTDDEEALRIMVEHLRELPLSWTIVQITKAYYPNMPSQTLNEAQDCMAPIHFTVFSGEHLDPKTQDPVTVTLAAPETNEGVRGTLFSEMMSSIRSRKITLGRPETDTSDTRKEYWARIYELETDAKRLQSDLEVWIAPWKCLLQGRLIDHRHVLEEIEKRLKSTLGVARTTDRQWFLLVQLAQISSAISKEVLRKSICEIFSGNNYRALRLSLYKEMTNETLELAGKLKDAVRGPVLLIVDDMLDYVPWESFSIFSGRPVSRLVSLHLLYALYSKYKRRMTHDGYVKVNNKQGRYVIDPDCTLKSMEQRMMSFMKYWLPHFTGTVGKATTSDKFTEMITESSVFVYAGHGGGTQIVHPDSIQRQSVKSVVFLSGCCSVCVTRFGLSACGGTHMEYHIAGSPCVVGYLWEVTDNDVDTALATILSTWLPPYSKNQKHFKHVNIDQWSAGIIEPTKKRSIDTKSRQPIGPLHLDVTHEPNLLIAIALARNVFSRFTNSSALVARGIPVKFSLES